MWGSVPHPKVGCWLAGFKCNMLWFFTHSLIVLLSSSQQQQHKSNTSKRTKTESETKSRTNNKHISNGGKPDCFPNNLVALVAAIIEFNLLSLKESGLLVNVVAVWSSCRFMMSWCSLWPSVGHHSFYWGFVRSRFQNECSKGPTSNPFQKHLITSFCTIRAGVY